MTSKKAWIVWVPGILTARTHQSHGPQTVRIGGCEERGQVYKPIDSLHNLTRDEAEQIARQRHGDRVIVTRRRGIRKPLSHTFEKDLRPE